MRRVDEPLRRFRADREGLAQLGLAEEVADIRPFLADTHEDGQSVSFLIDGSGFGVYHKPRPTLGRQMQALLAALHSGRVAERVHVPRQIASARYTWSMPAKKRGVPSPEALGELLAVSWLLGSVDLHDENVVYCDGRAIVVDDETIVAPGPLVSPGLPAHGIEALVFYAWALESTGLLGCSSIWDADGGSTRASILTAFERTLSHLRTLAVRGDLQRFLTPLSSARMRVVLRPTREYDLLRRNMDRPSWLDDTVAALSKPISGFKPSERLVREEALCLSRGDIPIYSMGASDSVLLSGHGTLYSVNTPLTAHHRVTEATRLLMRPATIGLLVGQAEMLTGAHAANSTAIDTSFLTVDGNLEELRGLLDGAVSRLLDLATAAVSLDLPAAEITIGADGRRRVVPLLTQSHSIAAAEQALAALRSCRLVTGSVRRRTDQLYVAWAEGALGPFAAPGEPPVPRWVVPARLANRANRDSVYVIYGPGDDVDRTDVKSRWRTESVRFAVLDPYDPAAGLGRIAALTCQLISLLGEEPVVPAEDPMRQKESNVD